MRSVFRARSLSWIIAVILCLLPFHAFFTTWIGANTGHLDLIRIWKEIIITGLVAITAIMVIRDQRLRQKMIRLPLLWLIIGYSLIQLAYGLLAHHYGRVNSVALIYGLIINLRYFWFFLVCLVIASKDQFLANNWAKILLIPASIVVAFGLIQKAFLPANFLMHFGYSPKTIPAYQTVDANIDYRRIQSTLRGANPLGTYLILIFLGFWVWLKKQKSLSLIALVFCAAAMFYTYSRSAWLGLAAGLAVLAWINLHGRRQKLVIALGLILITLIGGSAALIKNQSLQDTLLHTSSTSKSAQSSNVQRSAAEKAALKDVYHHPWGEGPGTAGPASFRNNHPAKIAENYYLQIAQEVGVVGLAVWLAMAGLALRCLSKSSAKPLSVLLIASFVGISLVNLVSHAWTDDTISLLWWGMAGVACAPVMLGLKHERLS